MRFEIGESDEVITTHAGLSLVGELLAKTQLQQRLNAIQLPGQVAPQVSHAEVAFAYTSVSEICGNWAHCIMNEGGRLPPALHFSHQSSCVDRESS